MTILITAAAVIGVQLLAVAVLMTCLRLADIRAARRAAAFEDCLAGAVADVMALVGDQPLTPEEQDAWNGIEADLTGAGWRDDLDIPND